MTAEPLLEARDLSHTVGGRPIVEHVSLRIVPGRFYALVGPNGAGKSTLLRLLAGDLRPSAGTVLLRGRPVTTYPPEELARLRAVLSQRTVLQFAFTVRQVVEMGRAPYARSTSRSADEVAVERALQRTGLHPFAARLYPTLSGGEQELAQLARVLAQETPLLFLDEPTSSLDLARQALLLEIVDQLRSGGVAVVAVVHDLALASVADEVWLLTGGRLVASGPPLTVLTPQRLSSAFGCPVDVIPAPDQRRLLVVPSLVDRSGRQLSPPTVSGHRLAD